MPAQPIKFKNYQELKNFIDRLFDENFWKILPESIRPRRESNVKEAIRKLFWIGVDGGTYLLPDLLEEAKLQPNHLSSIQFNIGELDKEGKPALLSAATLVEKINNNKCQFSFKPEARQFVETLAAIQEANNELKGLITRRFLLTEDPVTYENILVPAALESATTREYRESVEKKLQQDPLNRIKY